MASRSSPFCFQSRMDTITKHTSKLKSWLTTLLRPPRSPHAQAQSILFSALPIKIRCQIYGQLVELFGTVQHIGLLSNHRLAHMRCTVPSSHIYFQDYHLRYSNICVPYGVTYHDHYRKNTRNGWEIVPLLLTCKYM